MANNDHFFVRKGRPRVARDANERRAAIVRANMAPRDLSPAPHGTIKGLRSAWRAFCGGNNEDPQRYRSASLGRVRIASRGSLSSLRRGDLVLVWDDHPNARTPLYTVWHPRNPIMTGVSKDQVDIVNEGPRPQGILHVRGRGQAKTRTIRRK